jgi:radical SAM protein with 4Fe4S-binding SPASM domain
MAVQDIPVPYAVRKYFYQKAAVTRSPLSGNFELTPRCNMDCKMCYIRMSPEEMISRGRERTAEEWIDLGKACAERGMLFLLLTGGEPFLRPDFREIYTELKKLGLLISINTNGTLLDEQTVQWLSADAPMKVNVTVYGGSNDTYRRLCGHSTGFDAMKQGVERLRQAGIFVNLNASFTNYNVADIAAIGEFGREQGIPVTAATYMFPPVRSAREGKCDTAVRFAPEEAGLARARTDIEFLPEHVLKRKLKNLHSNCPLLSSTEECERCADEKMGCMAGKASFWVTWDGRMTPCGMMNQPVAMPFEEGFAAAWDRIVEQTEPLTLPKECGSCPMRPHCIVCGALCAAETGATDQKPEYLCRQTEVYLSEMEKEAGRRGYDHR